MAFFIIMLFARLFVKVDILLTCEKYLYDNIISLRGKIWDHKTSLIQPHFIEVSVPRQEWERSCICILRVLILSLSTILILDFRIVPTVWHFCFFILWTKRSTTSHLKPLTTTSHLKPLNTKKNIATYGVWKSRFYVGTCPNIWLYALFVGCSLRKSCHQKRQGHLYWKYAWFE